MKGGAVVSSSSGTLKREVVTSVGNRTPASSSVEGQAVSAVVISSAARWNKNANVSCRAPGVTGLA